MTRATPQTPRMSSGQTQPQRAGVRDQDDQGEDQHQQEAVEGVAGPGAQPGRAVVGHDRRVQGQGDEEQADQGCRHAGDGGEKVVPCGEGGEAVFHGASLGQARRERPRYCRTSAAVKIPRVEGRRDGGRWSWPAPSDVIFS